MHMRPNPHRGTSLTGEYASAYELADAIQMAAGVAEAALFVMDEHGPLDPFAGVQSLVDKQQVNAIDLLQLKAVYARYVAIWMIKAYDTQPSNPVPYYDWWAEGDRWCTKSDRQVLIPGPPTAGPYSGACPEQVIALYLVQQTALHQAADDYYANHGPESFTSDWAKQSELVRALWIPIDEPNLQE